MESKTIKISGENYKWLIGIASELQRQKGRPVSLDEAIGDRIKKSNVDNILNIAGTWRMSDKEAEKIKKSVKKGWTKWKIPSV
jgi:predicted CopG family antitoxin